MKPIDSMSDDDFTEFVQRAVCLPDAPPAVLQTAIDLWPKARPTTLGSLVETAGQVIHAMLNFDSWASPAVAFGMRSAGSDKRHLLFSAGERDVDLRINQVDGAFSITGQVLGPDEAGTIELAADSDTPGSETDSAGGEQGDPDSGQSLSGSRVTSLDELGEFFLDGIHAGTYRLTLRMGSDEIVLPPIVVREKPA